MRPVALALGLLVLAGSIQAGETRLIEAGSFSLAARGFVVIEDAENLSRMHEEVHARTTGPPSLPGVDFERDVVLMAFMGQKPSTGYAIRFEHLVGIEGEVARVGVIEDRPLPGAMLGSVITSPYAMARLARDGFEAVLFVDSEGKPLERVELMSGAQRAE